MAKCKALTELAVKGISADRQLKLIVSAGRLFRKLTTRSKKTENNDQLLNCGRIVCLPTMVRGIIMSHNVTPQK